MGHEEEAQTLEKQAHENDLACEEMSPEDVLTRLLYAHQAYFDTSRDHEFCGRVFEGYAEFHSSTSQYVLVKRAKLWEVSSHEYLFFRLIDHLTEELLEREVTFVTTQGLGKVQLSPDHMTSYLSLVVIARNVDEAAAHQAKKKRFRKNFKLGFGGWADLRLAIVDLSGKRVITNAMGKPLRQTLEANAF